MLSLDQSLKISREDTACKSRMAIKLNIEKCSIWKKTRKRGKWMGKTATIKIKQTELF